VGIKNAEIKIAIDATINFCIIRILNYNTTKHYLFICKLDLCCHLGSSNRNLFVTICLINAFQQSA